MSETYEMPVGSASVEYPDPRYGRPQMSSTPDDVPINEEATRERIQR
jgi:hypothetical protein